MFELEKRERELVERFPEDAQKIRKALEMDEGALKGKKEHEMSLGEAGAYRAQLMREKAMNIYKQKKAERVANMSFEKQKQIQKKLVTPMGEESENESEAEGDSQAQRTSSLSSPIIT